MSDKRFMQVVKEIVASDTRYRPDAYGFVCDALNHTQERILEKDGAKRHITGGELLEGIREYALQQFASMAPVVFDAWGITRCEDFGEIVFNLVEAGLLSKTETDSRSDFAGGFDFYEAFRVPYLPPSRRNKNGKPCNED